MADLLSVRSENLNSLFEASPQFLWFWHVNLIRTEISSACPNFYFFVVQSSLLSWIWVHDSSLTLPFEYRSNHSHPRVNDFTHKTCRRCHDYKLRFWYASRLPTSIYDSTAEFIAAALDRLMNARYATRYQQLYNHHHSHLTIPVDSFLSVPWRKLDQRAQHPAGFDDPH